MREIIDVGMDIAGAIYMVAGSLLFLGIVILSLVIGAFHFINLLGGGCQ